MPSLIEQINRSSPAVSVYNPGRLLPGSAVNARPVVPARPVPIAAFSGRRGPFPSGSAQAQAQVAGTSPWANLAARVTASPHSAANVAAAKAAQPDVPWWKQGLGMVFGNPVVENIMKPLGVLAYPGRAVVSSVDELADLITTAVGADKSGKMQASWSDWWKQINDPHYGFGTALEEASRAGSPEGKSNLTPWIKDVLGFSGDIALDPLRGLKTGTTMLTASELAASRAAATRELADVAYEAGKVKTAAAVAGKEGKTFDVSRLMTEGAAADERAAQLEKELAAMERKLAEGAPT